MARGVLVTSIQSRDQGGGERKIGLLQVGVRNDKLIGELALFLIKPEESLGRERWEEEERERPRRNLRVRDCQ